MPEDQRPEQPSDDGAQPGWVPPMLAVAGALPDPAVEEAFAFEMKWDGVRICAVLGADGVRLFSRNGNDVTAAYPELAGLGAALPRAATGRRTAVLDGEAVALDAAGKPDFGLLQRRMHLRDPRQVRLLRERVPVSYLIFDLLRLGRRDLLHLPYTDRRAELVGLGLAAEHWAVPGAWSGGGAAAFAASLDLGLEGVVAKRLTAPYQPGRRSRDWIKVKHVRMCEVVIGGWQPGAGRRGGLVGSLLLGLPAGGGRLDFVGHVGTGFTDAALADLAARLTALATRHSPFTDTIPRPLRRDARWVRPLLVGEVSFAGWTGEGRLRSPVWRGLRPDKAPEDLRREDGGAGGAGPPPAPPDRPPDGPPDRSQGA